MSRYSKIAMLIPLEVGKRLLALAWLAATVACFLARYNAVSLVGRVAGVASAPAYEKSLAMSPISELRNKLAITTSQFEKLEVKVDQKASILASE